MGGEKSGSTEVIRMIMFNKVTGKREKGDGGDRGVDIE